MPEKAIGLSLRGVCVCVVTDRLSGCEAGGLLSPSEVSHLHHDHTHLLGQNDDVISTVIPLGHLSVQLALFLLETGHLLGNLRLLLLG